MSQKWYFPDICLDFIVICWSIFFIFCWVRQLPLVQLMELPINQNSCSVNVAKLWQKTQYERKKRNYRLYVLSTQEINSPLCPWIHTFPSVWATNVKEQSVPSVTHNRTNWKMTVYPDTQFIFMKSLIIARCFTDVPSLLRAWQVRSSAVSSSVASNL